MTDREILARAKCIWRGIDPDEPMPPWGDETEETAPPQWQTFASEADCEIAALRERGRTIVPMEPTEAMLKAGAAEAPESPEDEDGCAYFYRGDVPAPIWRAMLSAASSEPTS